MRDAVNRLLAKRLSPWSIGASIPGQPARAKTPGCTRWTWTSRGVPCLRAWSPISHHRSVRPSHSRPFQRGILGNVSLGATVCTVAIRFGAMTFNRHPQGAAHRVAHGRCRLVGFDIPKRHFVGRYLGFRPYGPLVGAHRRDASSVRHRSRYNPNWAMSILVVGDDVVSRSSELHGIRRDPMSRITASGFA